MISKITEKVIHDQTQEFLDTNKILFKFQSGFRKGYSIDSCLSYLNNKIAADFEPGLHTGMILIDLQKAFETINHEILIKKMECLGFSKGVTLWWFKSYLSNRKFKVNLNQIFSEPGNLSCGVPQGSILGPLLFLLYINDLPQSVNCELLLYADTCLISQHNDIKEIENQLNKNFSLICD